MEKTITFNIIFFFIVLSQCFIFLHCSVVRNTSVDERGTAPHRYSKRIGVSVGTLGRPRRIRGYARHGARPRGNVPEARTSCKEITHTEHGQLRSGQTSIGLSANS